MDVLSRRRLLATVGAATLAGCAGLGGGGQSGDGGDGAAGSDGAADADGTSEGATSSTDANAAERTTVDESLGSDLGSPATSGDSGSTSGQVPTRAEQLPLPMSPTDLWSEAVSGGPPKDGIPSIDDPAFVAADEAGFLADGDPVFGVAQDGVVKAYPQRILVQHEIVNDDLGGTPVSVTYCPLTGTVQGFERGDTTFGVSGRLINNNLVMYDRATEAWWPQILATAIPGPWNDNPPTGSLREFRLVWTSWEQWRAAFPDTQVLSTDTGFARNYNNDPYGAYNPPAGYYANQGTLFAPLEYDDSIHSKRVVMGVRTPEGAVAFDKERLRRERQATKRIGETPILAVYDQRFDTVWTYANPDEREFTAEDGAFVGDDGTEHAPDALPLDHVFTFDAMWMAWNGYYPETEITVPADG